VSVLSEVSAAVLSEVSAAVLSEVSDIDTLYTN
jgi:hypothetical protein